MKNFLIIFCFFLTSITYGQSFSEKIARTVCAKLDSIENISQLNDSIKNEITKAIVQSMTDGTADAKNFGTVEGVTNTFSEVYNKLPYICYNVRRLIIEDKIKKFYKKSDIEQANIHYENGNKYMSQKDWKNSIKEFKAAIKLDNKFVYAYDHLAISFRRQENYKKAIKIYLKSLEIFPEGDLALLNIAVSYSFIKDYDNSLKHYANLKFLYPKNPEGYFGCAKILLIKSDYENALDNLFIAHRIYTETKSVYIKDSEQLVNLIYAKLKSLNKLDLFEKLANEHNINMQIH